MKSLDGWKKVYSFTFSQAIKRGGFKVVTSLVAFLIIAVCIIGNIVAARNADKESHEENITIDMEGSGELNSVIDSVYILDESGLEATDYSNFLQLTNQVLYSKTAFEHFNDIEVADLVKIASTNSQSTLVVHIKVTDNGYEMEGILPVNTIIREAQAKELVYSMQAGFENNKLMLTGLSQEQLDVALTTTITNYHKVGEETNFVIVLIKNFAPAFFGLIIYLMVILYGQTISQEVSTEKTTKLMETLLTNIHPYALIAGKVLAIASMAIMQMLIWIVSIVVGFISGDAIAHMMYPNYQNTIMTIIDFLRENIGESALTLPSVILAFVIVCLGFLFYSVLAGLAGSLVSKPEDVASAQAVFQFPVIIGFFMGYFGLLLEKASLISVSRFIPISAPFIVPAEVLTGSISLGFGILSAVILFVFSVIVIYLSARIYKGMVLYTGQKISLKKIIGVLRAKA